MRWSHVLCFVLFSGWVVQVAAQPIPVGCEFAVNAWAEGPTLYPKAAVGLDGGFTVVYLNGTDRGVGQRLMARSFDSAGNYLGPSILLDEAAEIILDHPDIARDRNGDFMVVWVQREAPRTGEPSSLFGRLLSSQGTPTGAIFEIDDSDGDVHSDVYLATSDGGSIVVWTEGDPDIDSEVRGRLVSVDGSVLGPELQINDFTVGAQHEPAVATTSDGEFLVVWRGQGDGVAQGIFGRRFDSNGSPLGGDITMDTSNTANFDDPDVAANNDGFLVVWSEREPTQEADIFSRQLDSSGVPVGANPVRLRSFNGATEPSVATRDSQDFVVAWNEFDYPGSGYPGDARARVASHTVGSDGVLGNRFQVGTEVNGYDAPYLFFRPDVAPAPDGDAFLVVWGNGFAFGSGHTPGSTFGQRYDALGVPSRTDVAIGISESEDPSDGRDLFYRPFLLNQETCSVADFDLEVQLPQALIDHGFTLFVPSDITCEGTETLNCSGTLRPGLTDTVAIFADPLPNETDLLEISASVTLDQSETDLSNNSATETTQVVRCAELTRQFTGKGFRPEADSEQVVADPCAGLDRFTSGSQVELTAAPAPDGWRVGSWSGTDDDASTSRLNTVTMPEDDSAVVVHYVFDGGIHWWTADNELVDLIGNSDLTQVGAGDPFDEDGNQRQAFRLDGDPILQTGPEGGLGQGSAFSFGFWVRVAPSAEDERSILDKRQAGASADRGVYAFLDQGRPALTLGDGAVAETFVSSRDLQDDTYHFVVYTHQQGLLRIYVDGLLESTHDTGQVGSFASLSPITLGTASLGDPRPLDGLLDEVFVSSAALDPERIESLALRPRGHWTADGNALDSTAQQLHGILRGPAGYTDGRCGLGFDLSAPGATVQIPPATGPLLRGNSFAFAAWLRAANGSGIQDIFDVASTSTNHNLYLSDGFLTYRLGSKGPIFGSSLGNLRDNELHFVGVSNRDLGGGQTEVTLWLDDVSLTVVHDDFVQVRDPGMVLGDSGLGPQVLDEVFIFDRYLDPEAMQRLRLRSCVQEGLFLDGFETGDVSSWSAALP